jgi:hypothetical protein
MCLNNTPTSTNGIIGEFHYHIAGSQAYQNYITPAHPEPEYPLPYPDVDYNYTPPNLIAPYVSSRPVRDSWEARTLEPVGPGQIRIETYPNNDINIVTPKTSEDSAVQDMLLVVRTDSNVKITPTASRSVVSRREMNYDDTVFDRRAQSNRKVSDWLSRGPSYGSEY